MRAASTGISVPPCFDLTIALISNVFRSSSSDCCLAPHRRSELQDRVTMHHGSHSSLHNVVIGALSIFLLLSGASSQKTEASCNSTKFAWAFNSRNQSPCLAAAFLGESCQKTNASFDIGSLKPNQSYTSGSGTICECNSVYYSLLSACTLCQGAVMTSWTKFASNCSKVSPDGQYPQSVPNGTVIPEWAFQQVFTSNQFNVSLAESGSSNNASSSTPTQSSSSLSIFSYGVSTTAVATSTPQPSSSSPAKKNHAGAIVGGVIGSICGLAIICGVILFVLRRRRDKHYATHSVQSRPKRASSFYLKSSTVRDMRSYANEPPTFMASTKEHHSPGVADGPTRKEPDQATLIIASRFAHSNFSD